MTGPRATTVNMFRIISIHVGVIVVRTQFFVLIYELILFPLKIMYINYNYPHIYLISNDLIHIELESSSKTYDLREGSFSLIKTFFDKLEDIFKR